MPDIAGHEQVSAGCSESVWHSFAGAGIWQSKCILHGENKQKEQDWWKPQDKQGVKILTVADLNSTLLYYNVLERCLLSGFLLLFSPFYLFLKHILSHFFSSVQRFLRNWVKTTKLDSTRTLHVLKSHLRTESRLNFSGKRRPKEGAWKGIPGTSKPRFTSNIFPILSGTTHKRICLRPATPISSSSLRRAGFLIHWQFLRSQRGNHKDQRRQMTLGIP